MLSRNLELEKVEVMRCLAEICGIHAGDGYLRNDGQRKELDISGNYEEKGYYDTHVVPLFSKAFGSGLTGRFFHSRGTYGFVIRDANVIKFMHERLGFPYGPKSLIVDVPGFIKTDASLIPFFLRGYFDTDGCLTFSKKYGAYSEFKTTRHWYPRLAFSTVSLSLWDSLKIIFKSMGFGFTSYTYRPKRLTESLRYRLDISGQDNLKKWLILVGMKNSSKHSKLLIWKKFGFCPPHTNFKMRQNILKGEINPVSLYDGPVV